MQQVLQPIDAGRTTVREVPAPVCGAREVLITNAASLVSAGTEKMIVDLARKSLIGKARERPDQVRRVLQKLKQEGVMDTVRQVRAKLADPLALGYSSAGTVIEVGCEVKNLRVGDRVASNGAHAAFVAVPQNLVAKIPAGVAFNDAAYAVVGAIGLQGVRLANVSVGDRVAVIGLGLIGQITVMLLRAAGCVVIGTDLDATKCERARAFGAYAGTRAEFVSTLEELTQGNGADAVLLTASTQSNEPLELAAQVARRKARIVAVGAVGMNVPRREFYPKELEFIVSCSYGAGRYDAEYEERGRDYPYAFVRWTEQRNIQTVLEQIAEKRLPVEQLTTHTFEINDAARAYEMMETNSAPFLGIVLTYPEFAGDIRAERRVNLTAQPHHKRAANSDEIKIGIIGAGNFASLVLLPALLEIPSVRPRMICSAGGVSASVRGERQGFEIACTDYREVLGDAQTDAVFILTRHHLHSEQTLSALKAGKAVFVEKPLAITAEQLEEFETGLHELGASVPLWMVGFNRRFSPAARGAREFFASVKTAMTINYRFNAGAIPREHWTQDAETGGGRIIGEACHALDLVAFLADSQIVNIYADAVAPNGAAGGSEDNVALVCRLANGALATIGYYAGGDKSFAKERIEIFGGGKVAVIDDFQTLTLVTDGKSKTQKIAGRDKGHKAELIAFVNALKNNSAPPIPYAALLNTSWASVKAIESLRAGAPLAVPTF